MEQPSEPPLKPSTGQGPAEGLAWMEELFFEQTFGHPPEDEFAAVDRPLPASEEFTRQELLGLPAAPPNLRSSRTRALVYRKLYGDKMDRLVTKILAEPVLKQAFMLWNPRDPVVNRNVGREIARYLTIYVSQIFDFNLSPITFVEKSKAFAGQFKPLENRVEVEISTFRGPLSVFVHTILHEQMHRYQAELIGRLFVMKEGKPLSSDEKALADYLKYERDTYPMLSDEAIRKNPEFKQRYLDNGLEVHANYVANYVTGKVLAGS